VGARQTPQQPPQQPPQQHLPPLSWIFVNQRDDDRTFEVLTKQQVEAGMMLVVQMAVQMGGIDIETIPNPNYNLSAKQQVDGWCARGLALLGYRVARKLTNPSKPFCFGTLVAFRQLTATAGYEEGWYILCLHDDGDTEELTILDVVVSIDLWLWYLRQQQPVVVQTPTALCM
jgi:hypothetical protein